MTSRIPPRNRPAKFAGNIALAILAAGLCSCSSGNSTDWEQAYRAVRQAWDPGSSDVTLQQASAVPYATMGVRVGDGAQQLIVLASAQQDTLLWTSAARIALETRDGRIVRSAGFPYNLGATVLRSADPLTDIASIQHPVSYVRLVDLPDQKLFSVALACTLSKGEQVTTKILGSSIPTIRAEEHCASRQTGWEFTNTFWVGVTSGFVWRSKQFIHPKMDAIEIVVLRAPG